MDEIDYIEQTAFFLNGSGNPIEIDHVINSLYSLVSDYDYSRESPEFVYYLDRIAEDMVISETYSMGPDPMEILPYKLVGDPQNGTDVPDDDYRFYIFYILAKLHFELDDYEGMRKLIERYENEFGEQPYFGKLEALSLMNSYDPETLSRALDVAYENSQNNPQYFELHRVLAEVIAETTEKDIQYIGANDDIPIDDQGLLGIGKREIERATEYSNYPAEYLLVKARIESLTGNHDTAKSSVSEAIRELSRSRTRYTDLKAMFGRVENRIETRRHQSELEHRTNQISESVDEIESKIDDSAENLENLSEEMDSIRLNFQRTFLEFLGFFSAIIAAIVITGQIALEIADPREAGRLIIVSYGGLLFAFGGFAAMIASDKSGRRIRIALSAIGLITAVLALYIDGVINYF